CYDIEKDKLTFTKVHEFLPNKIYHHGCLKSFFQITKWKARGFWLCYYTLCLSIILEQEAREV
ncbi:hypothetical protein HN873_059659, partial [Arachis hypogaea]